MLPLKETWINDYLDLYLYAKGIGDQEWETEILQKLTFTDNDLFLYHLWAQFDAINTQLLLSYQQLRSASNALEQEQLWEKVWNLKMERITVSQKIRSLW